MREPSGQHGQMVRRFASPANGAKRGVRLEWEGKQAAIDVPVLPFQTIETINEWWRWPAPSSANCTGTSPARS